MTTYDEHHEREQRAARLRQARVASGLGGARKLSQKFGWNENTYKSHELGRNGFGLSYARAYAKAFKVSLNWLMVGTGSPDDTDQEAGNSVIDVPLISWISAGQLTEQSGVMDYDDFPTVSLTDLAEGDWFALRVDGPSMNKISPQDSIIVCNRRDRRLVPNACYIISDEAGNATYKRYRPNENPPFQPASYENIPPPLLNGAVTVIARVRRSIIDM